MFWLRWIFYSSPVWLGFGAAWLYRSVALLEVERETGALVFAIQEPIAGLAPFLPHDGSEGEIAALLFEPLLRRDERQRLRPNLIERWTVRQVVTLRCASEEAAGEAEALVVAGEALPSGIVPLAIDRSGSVLAVSFEGSGEAAEAALLEGLGPDLLGDDLLVRVRAEHSVAELLGAWLAHATERSRLCLLELRGGGEADLYLRGDTDRFVEELRLYLESNPGTSPELEIVGRRSHSRSQELLLELRSDASWHDGRPFTAADVVFSHGFFTRPDSPLPLGAAFDHVETLTAAGPHRLRAALRHAPGSMMESWERLPLLPANRFEGASDLVLALRAFLNEPLGLGPYRLERRLLDGGVELAAHEAYHRGVPAQRRCRYRRFPSLESVLLALSGGELDVIEPDERFADWARRHPEAVGSLRDLPRFQHLVAWNLDREPFDRAGVRTALARAFDAAAILRDGPDGFTVPARGLFLAGTPFAAEPMLLPLHDPRGAANLLGREGFELDEADGRRRDAGGRPLSFSLLVNGENKEHRKIADALAEQWSGLGIDVQVDTAPWQEIVARRLPSREFDAVLLSWALPVARDLRALWHSSSAVVGGGNVSGLRNAEVDALVARLHLEADPAALAETAAALQRSLAALQPCLFLAESGRIVQVRDGAVEVRPPGAGRTPPSGEDGEPGDLLHERPWWTRSDLP